jgi:ADP-heptose:LPS heptosyltransferase
MGQPITLRKFHETGNKILIVRKLGGMGDVVMHRMIFEDIKLLDPSFHVTFACPPEFYEYVDDHPFIDKIENSKTVKYEDYMMSFDTTRCCLRYEMSTVPNVNKNRPDIWASHCGITLLNHNMHFQISDEMKQWGADKINSFKTPDTKGVILLCPYSNAGDRSLLDWQLEGIVQQLKEMDYSILALHGKPSPKLAELNVPVLTLTPKKLISVINASDYIVSVDTGTFHIAGGLRKPMVGVFVYTDGKVRGNCYDFILVQKHRDDGWPCGPCWFPCKQVRERPYPCIKEITVDMIMDGINKMLQKWPLSH